MNQFMHNFSKDISQLMVRLRISSADGFKSEYMKVASYIYKLLVELETKEEEKAKADTNYKKKELVVLRVLITDSFGCEEILGFTSKGKNIH